MTDGDQPYVLIGRVAAAHGVRGWLKIKSFTDPPANALSYQPWYFARSGASPRLVEVSEQRVQGKNLLVRIEGREDRNAAEAQKGSDIFTTADALPPPESDEYYWRDLIGMTVTNHLGAPLGTVKNLLETGAHDVLQISGLEAEVLVPFVAQYVQSVDVQKREIVVVWEEDWP